MLKPRAYRPDSILILEDRSLPSGLTITLEVTGTVSAPVASAAAIEAAFIQFRLEYDQAVLQILAPPGTTNPSTNAAAFNARIANLFTNLNNSLSSNLVNLNNPTSIASTIQSEVVGSGPTSLASQLAALSPPTTGNPQLIQGFILQANQRIAQAAAQVAEEIVPTSVNATLPAVRQNVEMVQRQIESFSRDYLSAAKALLYSKGPTTPTALQGTFASKLSSLQKSLHKTLAEVPDSQTLLAEVDSLLVGTKATSLKNILSAIPIATTNNRDAIAGYSEAVSRAIQQTEQQIVQAITGAVGLPVDTP